MSIRTLTRAAVAGFAAAVLAGASGAAAAIVDPAGDFLGTYTGPQNGDLDLLGVGARRDATGVTLGGVVNGTFGATPNSLAIFFVNRGAGTPGMLAVGPPPITSTALHDGAVFIRPDGSLQVILVGGGPPSTFIPASAGLVTIDGSSFEARVDFSLLPSMGFAPAAYTYVAATRSSLGPTSLIADIAPGTGQPFTASVPEPGTWAMMIAGLGGVGRALRRRRSLAVA